MLHPTADLQINALTRSVERFGENTSDRDNVYTVQGKFSLFDGDELEAEYGISDSTRDDSATDNAYLLNYRGAKYDVRYSLRHRHFGPDYYGYSRDTEYTSAAVSFPLYKAIRSNLSYLQYQRNLDRLDARGAAQMDEIYRGGISFPVFTSWKMSFDYEHFLQYDRMPEKEFNYVEDSLIMGISRSLREGSIRLDLRRGWQEDRLTGEEADVWNLRMYSMYRPHQKFHLSFFVSLGDDDTLARSRRMRRSSDYGGRAHWIPVGNLYLYMDYRQYDFEEAETHVDSFSAGINYRFPNTDKLGFEFRRSTWSEEHQRDTYFLIYTKPFSLPVGKKQSVGALEGKVYDAHKWYRPGLEGIILSVDGTAAVTDKKGKFKFPSLKPGEYEIIVDPESLGPEYVPEVSLPIKINIKGGEQAESEIGIVKAGSLFGKVMIARNDQNRNNLNSTNQRINNSNSVNNGANILNSINAANLQQTNNNKKHIETRGFRNLLVELKRNEDVKRTITDSKGRFLFERLQPGEWELKVYDHNLPEHHYLSPTEKTISISPGKQEVVNIEILPRMRDIKIIDEGEVEANVSN